MTFITADEVSALDSKAKKQAPQSSPPPPPVSSMMSSCGVDTKMGRLDNSILSWDCDVTLDLNDPPNYTLYLQTLAVTEKVTGAVLGLIFLVVTSASARTLTPSDLNYVPRL